MARVTRGGCPAQVRDRAHPRTGHVVLQGHSLSLVSSQPSHLHPLGASGDFAFWKNPKHTQQTPSL